MPDFISITADDSKLQHALTGGVKALDAVIRPVARPLSDEVFLGVRAQYNSKGARGPTGKPWTRKQSTIDRYTAINKKGFKVLNQEMRATDALYISEATRGGPHGIYEVEDSQLTMGTDLPYGLIQQRRGQKQYDPTEEDLKRYASIIKRGVAGKFKDLGFDYKDDSEIPF